LLTRTFTGAGRLVSAAAPPPLSVAVTAPSQSPSSGKTMEVWAPVNEPRVNSQSKRKLLSPGSMPRSVAEALSVIGLPS